jgi:hypothetical protein
MRLGVGAFSRSLARLFVCLLLEANASSRAEEQELERLRALSRGRSPRDDFLMTDIVLCPQIRNARSEQIRENAYLFIESRIACAPDARTCPAYVCVRVVIVVVVVAPRACTRRLHVHTRIRARREGGEGKKERANERRNETASQNGRTRVHANSHRLCEKKREVARVFLLRLRRGYFAETRADSDSRNGV